MTPPLDARTLRWASRSLKTLARLKERGGDYDLAFVEGIRAAADTLLEDARRVRVDDGKHERKECVLLDSGRHIALCACGWYSRTCLTRQGAASAHGQHRYHANKGNQ